MECTCDEGFNGITITGKHAMYCIVNAPKQEKNNMPKEVVMINSAIRKLNAKLKTNHAAAQAIHDKLQAQWCRVFDKSPVIVKAISDLENSVEYRFNEYGEIESYLYLDLSDFKECRDYLRSYFADLAITLERDGDCLTLSQGDCIIIQDQTRRDNGVWFNGKCVIDEIEYRLEGLEVNVAKRNELIEAYIEKTGCYPGVFRCDRHGSMFPVKTN
jgi:hypothetical protein